MDQHSFRSNYASGKACCDNVVLGTTCDGMKPMPCTACSFLHDDWIWIWQVDTLLVNNNGVTTPPKKPKVGTQLSTLTPPPAGTSLCFFHLMPVEISSRSWTIRWRRHLRLRHLRLPLKQSWLQCCLTSATQACAALYEQRQPTMLAQIQKYYILRIDMVMFCGIVASLKLPMPFHGLQGEMVVSLECNCDQSKLCRQTATCGRVDQLPVFLN